MKRLLFFPGYRILAYEWARGQFRRTEAFEPDEEGRAAFRDWLRENPKQPLQMLLDVIEEEFHVDRVPHVIGRDRAQLFERTARRHFRSSEFHYIVHQGREAGGRRDDRVLVAGLTNPDLLRTWLSVIDDAAVPLRGIYSLPLVSESLLPALGASRAERALVISQQIPSTLRQSYFENGRLRFSRLVPGRYSDAGGFAEFFHRELRKTLRFLETQRFRSRGAHIDVYVLVSTEIFDIVRDQLSSTEAVTCHLVPLESIARRIGMRGPGVGAFADTIFGHLLLRQRRPPNHYGLRRLRRHFFAQRGRLALAGLTTLLFVAAVAVAIGIGIRSQVYEQSIAVAQQRTAEFERRYQLRLQQLGQFDYRAQDVKSAVDLLGVLREARLAHPGAALGALGNALEGHPSVIVNRLRWWQSGERQPVAAQRGDRGRTGGETGLLNALADNPGKQFRFLTVEGDVLGFKDDYRRTVDLFDAFVDSVRSQPGVRRVDIVETPFALGSDTDLSGDSGLSAGAGRTQSGGYRLLLQLGDGS